MQSPWGLHFAAGFLQLIHEEIHPCQPNVQDQRAYAMSKINSLSENQGFRDRLRRTCCRMRDNEWPWGPSPFSCQTTPTAYMTVHRCDVDNLKIPCWVAKVEAKGLEFSALLYLLQSQTWFCEIILPGLTSCNSQWNPYQTGKQWFSKGGPIMFQRHPQGVPMAQLTRLKRSRTSLGLGQRRLHPGRRSKCYLDGKDAARIKGTSR